MYIYLTIIIIGIVAAIILLAKNWSFFDFIIVLIQIISFFLWMSNGSTFSSYLFMLSIVLALVKVLFSKNKHKFYWLVLFFVPICLYRVFIVFNYPYISLVNLSMIVSLFFYIYSFINYSKNKQELVSTAIIAAYAVQAIILYLLY